MGLDIRCGPPGVPVAAGPASRTLASSYSMRIEGFWAHYGSIVMRRISGFAAATAGEALDRAGRTSLIDIIIANLDLTGEDDGLAVITKRVYCGLQRSRGVTDDSDVHRIGKPALVADVFSAEKSCQPR